MTKPMQLDPSERTLLEEVKNSIATAFDLKSSLLGNFVFTCVILIFLLLIHYSLLPQYCVWIPLLIVAWMTGITAFCKWTTHLYARLIIKVCSHTDTTGISTLCDSHAQLLEAVREMNLTKEGTLHAYFIFGALPVVLICFLVAAVHIFDDLRVVNWLILLYATVLACYSAFVERKIVECFNLLRKIAREVLDSESSSGASLG